MTVPKNILEKMDEFELKQSHKRIEVNGEAQDVYLHRYENGDFYTDDIKNAYYFYFEKRFIELIGVEILKKGERITWASKESVIKSVLSQQTMRRKLLKIILRKGVHHRFRWGFWKTWLELEGSPQETSAKIINRRSLYLALLQQNNNEVRTIVTKDVPRTANGKVLFERESEVGWKCLYNISYALGNYFKEIGYVQGMNFIVYTFLEISGIEEFEVFNLIINLWTKKRNLFYGIYSPGFPVLHFMEFAFFKILALKKKKLALYLQKLDLPNGIWLTKWFITFFTFSLPKEYLLRAIDLIMVRDIFGPVYVAVEVAAQLNKEFYGKDFPEIAQMLQSKEIIGSKLDFYKFVKDLKEMKIRRAIKIELLEDYFSGLPINKQNDFRRYYDGLKEYLSQKRDWREDFNNTDELYSIERDKEKLRNLI